MFASPPFLRLGPDAPAHPVIVAVPHAGRLYPPAMLAAARVPQAVLEGLEDRLADLLATDAAAAGTPVFVALPPRTWLDLNRAEAELDRTMVSPMPRADAVLTNARVRGGLGLIPRRASGGAELWRGPVAAADVAARIATLHRPWHAALAGAMAAARDRFGHAILLDLHSMPPLPCGAGPPARLVIGDRHGHSADPALRHVLLATARAAGLPAAVNAPYAGGHTLDRHGRPADDRHAIQLEIDRTLYLSADGRAPGAGLDPIRRLVADMVAALAGALPGEAAIAAE